MTQWGLDTLFNPAKRHMDEEKRRLQSTREELGDSSGGKRIDLESGRVRIQRSESSTEDATQGEKKRKKNAKPEGEPSAAARRAAQRRGRAI